MEDLMKEPLLTNVYIYNLQQQAEIDNVRGGVLHRFYESKEYNKLTDDLLNDLSISLQEDTSKIKNQKLKQQQQQKPEHSTSRSSKKLSGNRSQSQTSLLPSPTNLLTPIQIPLNNCASTSKIPTIITNPQTSQTSTVTDQPTVETPTGAETPTSPKPKFVIVTGQAHRNLVPAAASTEPNSPTVSSLQPQPPPPLSFSSPKSIPPSPIHKSKYEISIVPTVSPPVCDGSAEPIQIPPIQIPPIGVISPLSTSVPNECAHVEKLQQLAYESARQATKQQVDQQLSSVPLVQATPDTTTILSSISSKCSTPVTDLGKTLLPPIEQKSIPTGLPIRSKRSMSVMSHTPPVLNQQRRIKSDHQYVSLMEFGFDIYHSNPIGVQILRKFAKSEHSLDSYVNKKQTETYQPLY
jgi:hypothetical protein